MNGILGTVFSRSDALKRQLYDMLTSPKDYSSMVAGRTQEAARAAEALQNQAFNPDRPTQITDQAALQKLTDMIMAGPMGFAPAGITAYHGSPYLFRQFDPSKMGTGEGAQAYGVGAGYTAESKRVAQSYLPSTLEEAAQKVHELEPQLEKYKTLQRLAKKQNDPEYAQFSQKVAELTNEIKKAKESTGYIYKGDIPDEILPKFLDWDKPLYEQSKEVKEALAKIPHRGPDWTFKDTLESLEAAPYLRSGHGMNPTGQEIYNMLGTSMMVGNKASGQLEVTQKLNEAGIRGIRYLDQRSRGEGKGTSNFIPFRAEDYKIQEINDIPLEDWISKGLLNP